MRVFKIFSSTLILLFLSALHTTSANPHDERAISLKNKVAGKYVCQGAKNKFNRALTLIESTQHKEMRHRFFTYNVYFSGNADKELNYGNKVFSNAVGYIIFDTQKLSGVGYLENQVDNRIRGAGLLEFEINNDNVSFKAYFIDRFRDMMGSGHCTHVSQTEETAPLSREAAQSK